VVKPHLRLLILRQQEELALGPDHREEEGGCGFEVLEEDLVLGGGLHFGHCERVESVEAVPDLCDAGRGFAVEEVEFDDILQRPTGR